MKAPPHTTRWSPGDTAIIADGEFGGMYARVWEINFAENNAKISLCVFRENEPFEIELSSLQRPTSSKGFVVRAALLSTVTLMTGPMFLSAFLLILDFFQDRGLAQSFSFEVVAIVGWWPLCIGGFFAIYVGVRVLTDNDRTEYVGP